MEMKMKVKMGWSTKPEADSKVKKMIDYDDDTIQV